MEQKGFQWFRYLFKYSELKSDMDTNLHKSREISKNQTELLLIPGSFQWATMFMQIEKMIHHCFIFTFFPFFFLFSENVGIFLDMSKASYTITPDYVK